MIFKRDMKVYVYTVQEVAVLQQKALKFISQGSRHFLSRFTEFTECYFCTLKRRKRTSIKRLCQEKQDSVFLIISYSLKCT